MSRRTLATLILSVWIGTLGWLAERHYLGVGRARGGPRWPVPPGYAFQSIRLGDRQYGFASLTVDTLEAGLRVTELVTLDLPPPRAGTRRRTTYRVEGLYSRGLQLLRWRTDLLTEQGRTSGSGEVLNDSLLKVTGLTTPETADTFLVRLRRPIILPSAIPLVAASRGLPRPGSRLNLEVFDPLDLELRNERLQVTAESLFTVPDSATYSDILRRWRVARSDTVRAWRLDATVHGLPISRWVDAAGMTVRLDNPLGARFEQTAFEIANSNYRARPPAQWDSTPSAPDYQAGRGTPTGGRRLIVRARLTPDWPLPADVPALESGSQTRAGDTLAVGVGAPIDTGGPGPIPEEIRASPDSTIRSIAAHILRTERRQGPMARKLTAWVRRSITVREGPNSRSAGAILGGPRVATPQERLTALVALARAAGLEARPVWGLVHIDGRWELRPWAEIRTDRWVPVDPATPPSAGLADRIRVSVGGEARLLDLALRAGRLRLDVLEETR
jgi:Transglutaminase-like superfamily